MAIRRTHTVVDAQGVRARIRDFSVDDAHATTVIVELPNGATVSLPTELLHPHSDGGYAISAAWSQLAQATTPEADAGESLELPMVAEEVRVTVRDVPRERLRVRRRVITEDHVVEMPVWREHITVDRVPRDEVVDRMPEPRQEGDVLVVPCVEEEVVVQKRLRVREELRIRVIREQRIHRQTVPVRRHELEVEHDTDADTAYTAGGPNPTKKHQGEPP